MMKSHKVSRWSTIRLLKDFCFLTGLEVDSLEPYVIAMKSARTGTARVVNHPRVPFNLNSKEGAKILGYRGDAHYQTSAIHNLDRGIHEDYKRAVLATVGDVPFTETLRPSDGFLRTNVGILVTMLTTVAGMDNEVRQKLARNPAPSWFFLSGNQVRTNYLRCLFETEGSPTREALKLSQATWVEDPHDPLIRKWPQKVSFSKLSENTKRVVLQRPPLLLVSASLLLHMIGIKSYLSPSRLASTKSGCSAYWLLQIYRTVNMRKFEKLIGFVSANKRTKLAHYNQLHRPR
jgi:hypothetical protein